MSCPFFAGESGGERANRRVAAISGHVASSGVPAVEAALQMSPVATVGEVRQSEANPYSCSLAL